MNDFKINPDRVYNQLHSYELELKANKLSLTIQNILLVVSTAICIYLAIQCANSSDWLIFTAFALNIGTLALTHVNRVNALRAYRATQAIIKEIRNYLENHG